jgi:hypothetical protein
MGKALYGPIGSRPDDPRAARIEVLFVKYRPSMTAQLGPNYEVTLFFRAQAVKRVHSSFCRCRHLLGHPR